MNKQYKDIIKMNRHKKQSNNNLIDEYLPNNNSAEHLSSFSNKTNSPSDCINSNNFLFMTCGN